MCKYFWVLILILFIVVQSNTDLYANEYREESYRTISKIEISGLKRTERKLILNQLPYQAQDRWYDSYEWLTQTRLEQLYIFDPLTFDVRIVEVDNDNVEVYITVEDRNPFMIHPVEFVIFKGIDLFEQQITQRVRNPFGNGLSFQIGYNWSTNSWWEVGLEYIGKDGLVYYADYHDFSYREEFNSLEYIEEGFRNILATRYISESGYIYNYNLTLQKNDYINQEGFKIEQKYIIPGININWQEYGDLNFDFNYGHSLESENPNFFQLYTSWSKEFELNNDNIVFALKGGLSSKETPLNYQFKAGGYSDIPLRGRREDMAGVSYLLSNIEYHKFLIYDLWGLSFIDAGKIVTSDSTFTEEDWIVNIGCGLFYITPLAPLRFDIGYDIDNNDYNINIALGHTF